MNGDGREQLEEIKRLIRDSMGEMRAELLASLEEHKQTCGKCHDRITDIESIVYDGDEDNGPYYWNDGQDDTEDVLERAHRRTVERLKG